MKIGSSLAFIGVGALLAFAVTGNTSVFNFHTAGWVLMLVGVIGLFLPRTATDWLGRRLPARRTYPGGRVEQIPPYTARNPGTAIVAELPSRPTLAGQDARGRDLIEDPEYDPAIYDTEYDPATYETPSHTARPNVMRPNSVRLNGVHPNAVPPNDVPLYDTPPDGLPAVGYRNGYNTGRPPAPGVTEVFDDRYEEP